MLSLPWGYSIYVWEGSACWWHMNRPNWMWHIVIGIQVHYYIVVLAPFHAWSGLLITNMFQYGLKERITEAEVLAPGEAILFFGRWSCKEGFPYTSARDVGFSLTGTINWARRRAQVEATTDMVQEGHWPIASAVMEKKMKTKGLGCPRGLGRAIQSLAGACNVDDLMQGLDEGVSDGEVRMTSDACTQCSVGHGRWCQWQIAPMIPRGSPRG